MRVGIRELTSSLSRYLRRVRKGESLVVTERGRPVARTVPAGVPEDILRLIAQGRVTWSGGRFRPPGEVPRLRGGPPLSDSIAEDRG